MRDASLCSTTIQSLLKQNGPTDPKTLLAQVQARWPQVGIDADGFARVVSSMVDNGHLLAHPDGLLRLSSQGETTA